MTGLNHIYTSHTPVFLDYDELYKKLIKKMEKTFAFIPSNSLSDTSFQHYLEKINKYVNLTDDFVNSLFVNYEMSCIDDKYLKSGSQNGNLICFNQNNENLLVDYLVIKYFKKLNYFGFLNENDLVKLLEKEKDEEKKDLTAQTRLTIVFDISLNTLSRFTNYQAWLCLLTPFTLSTFEYQHESSANKILNENLTIVKEKGNFYHFSCKFFYNLENFLPKLIEINNKYGGVPSSEKFQSILNDEEISKVLTINRAFFKKSGFQKAHFFMSDSNILYSSHLGGNDIKVNGQFDSVIYKTSDPDDLSNYRVLFGNIKKFQDANPDCFFLNSASGLEIFLDRRVMVTFLSEFCKQESIKSLSDINRIKLPKSWSCPLHLLLNVDDFKQFLTKNNTILKNVQKLIIIQK
jgi:hypothetical protein